VVLAVRTVVLKVHVVLNVNSSGILWQFCGKYSSICRSLLPLPSASIVPGLFGTAEHRRRLTSTPMGKPKIPLSV
jgi:hypothetical protein